MSDLKGKVTALVEDLWCYGGDIASNGGVIETTADTVEAAAREYLRPEECAKPVRVQFDDFKNHAGIFFDPADEEDANVLARHNELVALLEPYQPVYAQIGGDDFYPENLQYGAGVGGFHHCLFVKPGDGKNLLILFPCSL